MTLLCASEASDPSFVSYNGTQLSIEWKTPAACGDDKTGDDNDSDDGSSGESVGSGIGWFFLVYVPYRVPDTASCLSRGTV